MIIKQSDITEELPIDPRSTCDEEVLTEPIPVIDESMADDIPEPSPPRSDIADKLDELFQGVESQRQKIDQLLARDEMLQHVSRRLSAYEQNEWQRTFVEPLTRKIALIHRRLLEHLDHTKRMLKQMPRPLRQHSTFAWVQQILEGERVDLESVLSDFGVEVFSTKSDRFDRSTQEVIKRVQTNDPELVNTVARRIAPGFRTSEKVIIAERVAVYVQATNKQS